MKKLIGIMLFDVLMILTPLMIDLSPDLVDWVSYLLIALSSLTVLTLIFSEEGDESLKKIETEHEKRPLWWNRYDLISDVAFAFMWSFYGFYVVVFLLILTKILITVKIPNYYKRNKNA